MRHWQTTGNSNVAIKTGSTYISQYDRYHCNSNGIWFSTTPSAKKLTQGDCDHNRKWQCGRQNRKHLYIWNYGRQDDSCNCKLWFFDLAQLEETNPGRFQQQPTTGNCNMDVLLANLAISGSRLLSQSSLWAVANPLSTSTSSKIPNLAWEFRRYLSQFQACNYLRFWGHIDISGCRSLLYLLVNIILYLHIVLYPSVIGILTVPFVA